ncbi:MAG: glycosyltransferase family 39 protein [Phycisphaerae bacterium]|nr:glycosyltransferase family 39 protein [Phycisphaerae bacterium]
MDPSDASSALPPTAAQPAPQEPDVPLCEPRAPRVRGWEYVVLVVVAAVLVAFRLHAWLLPLEADECNYAYIGARLLEGKQLYVDVWDHQPWGVFALVAGTIALFGDHPEVFRSLSLIFSLATMVLVFGVTRRVASSWAAVIAALVFAIVSSDPGTAGEGCNREIYMNALILAAWYLALRWGSKNAGGAALLLAAGVSLGLASTIKTVVAAQWLALAFWVGGVAAFRGRGTREQRDGANVTNVVSSILLFGLGPLAIWILTGAYFGLTGRWEEFIDAVFLFNLSYSDDSGGLLSRFATFFHPPHPFTFQSALPVWAALVAAVIWIGIAVASGRRRGYGALLLLAVSSFVAVCMPGKFWPHYYYLMIPVGAIAAGLISDRGVVALQSALRKLAGPWHRIAMALYVVIPAWALTTQYNHYLSQSLYGITFKRYNSRDFWSRAQGENAARATLPDDKIFVFSNDACIYYYSDRRCASRYTMATGLDINREGAPGRWRILLDELRADPPRLILLLFDFAPGPGWPEFLKEHYGEPVGYDLGDCTGEVIMLVLPPRGLPTEPIADIDWNWDRRSIGGWCVKLPPIPRQ